MTDKIIFGYKDNDSLRRSFNDLSKIAFNTDFEEWYQKKLWVDRYEPYSIVRDGRVISNASVNKLKLLVNGEIKTAIQIGTVMTDEKFRGQGLSRLLMEHILDKFEKETDIFYLFANETVLDYYPRFGFKRRTQYSVSTKDVIDKNDKFSYRKLNIDDPADISILQRVAKSRILNSSTFDVIDGHEILGFYSVNVYRDRIYYDEKENIIVLYRKVEDKLIIHDIILTEKRNYREIIGSITDVDIKEIHFGFNFDTDNIVLIEEEIIDDDNVMFVKGDLDKNIKIIYPIVTQA